MSAMRTVNEQRARRIAASAIRMAREEGRPGFDRPIERLKDMGFWYLMRDDVDAAREYARAAVLVEESRDRRVARWLREREAGVA